MGYWERLSHLQMISQQRRLERYRIIYVWKVLKGLAPYCGISADSKNRLGRICSIPKLVNTSSSKIKTLRVNCFQVHGPRLFNCLPIQLRNLTRCTVDEFKAQLDKVLSMVPDEPEVSGCQYTPQAYVSIHGKALKLHNWPNQKYGFPEQEKRKKIRERNVPHSKFVKFCCFIIGKKNMMLSIETSV